MHQYQIEEFHPKLCFIRASGGEHCDLSAPVEDPCALHSPDEANDLLVLGMPKKQLARLIRSLYQDMVQKAKDTVKDHGIHELCPCDPYSREITMHYSFDFAQQAHFSSNPLQPGPMYCLTTRKCGLFCVNCEAIPRQVNYLIDESVCITKGPNAVVSFLDHFFTLYGMGERHVQLHCDNFVGQNKNNIVLQYLLWRVLHGLHETISLNFLIWVIQSLHQIGHLAW